MHFNPQDPAFRANPYPTYHALRLADPLYFWEPWGAWFLTAHEDCNALLRDERLGHGAAQSQPPAQEADLWRMTANWMLFKDPPDHTRLRGLVHKAFSPRMVERLQGTVQAMADQLLDRAQPAGKMDLVTDLALPLPVMAIAAMMGVPGEDYDRFHGWSLDLARSLDLTDDPQVYQRASAAAALFRAYLEELTARRRQEPGEDLLSALVQAEEAGDRLTPDELYGTCALLLMAGHETTVNLIGNGAYALLQHPDQLQLLRENPGLMRSAVEELLRYDSPVQLTSRLILTDMEYKGVSLPQGSSINFMLGAANRDPALYPQPDQLDLTRNPNPHLAFGSGIHYCLGAPLARLEGQIAFATLLRRMPHLRLASEDVPYRDNYVLRGLERLPVLF